MSTFSPVTLDRLVEPLSTSRVERQNTSSTVNNNDYTIFSRLAIQPALYATPEATPLPTSPLSLPPSPPYVINHKRRGPNLVKSLSQSDVGGCDGTNVEVEQKDLVVGQDGAQDGKVEGGVKGEEEGVSGDVDVELHEGKLGDVDESDKVLVQGAEIVTPYYAAAEREGESDDFFDPNDSFSMSSSTEIDDGSAHRWWKPGTSLAEYYDAYEEISSDSASRSYPNIEDELRQTRVSLLMEIERRKRAEEAFENLQIKWQMLSRHLSLVGLRLPVPPNVADEGDERENINPIEELCQQVVVTRCVADAVARACSRAEVEMEMKPLIESKNFETARLLDRIHYYEAANREMCQRNQEAVETARKRRIRNKRRKKWFWGSIVLAVTVGSAAIAWSYLPVPWQTHDDAKECTEN